MERKSSNQERGRKRLRGKTKAIIDSQPSKAPGQDQEVKEFLGPTDSGALATASDRSGSQQGISNRPAREERASPDNQSAAQPVESDPTIPHQQSGNRGGV